jgi:hypothetical protein
VATVQPHDHFCFALSIVFETLNLDLIDGAGAAPLLAKLFAWTRKTLPI